MAEDADKRAAVEAMREALNEGRLESALERADDDVVFDWSNSIGPMKGIFRGRDEVLANWGSWRSAWSEVHWEPLEVIDVDEDRFVIVTHVRMRGHGSGAEVEAGGALLWTFRDGLALSVTLFQSKQEALEAASAEPG